MQAQSKIIFASLFGIHYDADLAIPWVNHYKQFDINEFIIFLHSKNDNDIKLKEFKKFFESHKFKAHIVNEMPEFNQKFYDGGLRKRVLTAINKSIDYNDYLITADSDEFQQIPDSYRESVNSKDILCGVLVDRYTDKLKKYNPDLPLETQYPLKGDVSERVYEIADKRFFKIFNWVSNDKIIMAHGKMPVAFGGSHRMYDGYENKFTYANKDNPIPINHYRWRENVIDRMAQRKYNKAIHIWYYMQFFNVPDPVNNPAFKMRLEREEALQERRGWKV